MSAFVMVLAAGMAIGSAPGQEQVFGETEDRRSLAGEWEGTPVYDGTLFPARLILQETFLGVVVHLSYGGRNKQSVHGILTEDGSGRFRLDFVLGRKGESPLFGIYTLEGDRLTICMRSRHRPTSFQARQIQVALALHRFKPGK
jgi:uncharacterized protein (TIGR03067 family)